LARLHEQLLPLCSYHIDCVTSLVHRCLQ
jgi:hypothetical protein